MNFPPQLEFIFSFLPWLYDHGLRVVFIVMGAFLCDMFLRDFLSKKSLGPAMFQDTIKQRISGAQRQRMQTIINVISGTLSFVIFVIAVMMIMPEFGVNIAPILAGLGLAGLAVSMAAKDVLTDFITGFFILSEGQYNIGDKVKISGIEGIVREISLRRTMIETEDGIFNYIPNREIKIVSRKKAEHDNETNNDVY
ncbi:MAG TPA: mechanosensitive ion channel [Candidatus Paceibacterota bacterium]|nr:mechanosensitive ion channel [Candidatus Pacearchaeota archaeon]HRZ50817.1 mechanosensitive ion channel [Candidatus Paceibacterota bacterium]HSA36538.1 mechanosensitive ion channel [Candidatus Paceibacterota bacterium]